MNRTNSLSGNQKKVSTNKILKNNTINATSKQNTTQKLYKPENKNYKKLVTNLFLFKNITIKFIHKDIEEIDYKYYNFKNLLTYLKERIEKDKIITYIFLMKDNNPALPIYFKFNYYEKNIEEITTGSTIEIYYVPKLGPIELANFILKGTDGPERINKLKPAATLNNGDTKQTFYYNWISYKDEERNIVKHILSDALNLDIDIYFRDPYALFYSKKHITLLAEIYDYSLIKALNNLTVIFKHNNKGNDFIHICFGDLYGLGGLKPEEEVKLKTNNGRLKLNKYLEKIKEIEEIERMRIFNKKVNMKNSTYNRK